VDVNHNVIAESFPITLNAHFPVMT